MAVAALLVRCLSVVEPLGIDQSLWASAVRGMSRGQLLYRDVWEQRPPGIYWIDLAGFRALGWTPATVAWLDIAASAATTGLIYAIARRLARPPLPVLAAALYALFTVPGWLYRYDGFLERSVCETFITTCAAAAAWCAVAAHERARGGGVFVFGLGLFGGAAVVLKPNAGLYLPALLAWLLLYRRTAPTDRGTWLREAVLTALGAAIVPAIALVWLWRLGLLHDARVAVIDFNRFYVSQGFSPGTYALAFAKAVWLRIKTEPLWLAGAAGALAAMWDAMRTRRLPASAALAVLWGGAGALVIVVNGARLFNSYFIQVLAPLALLGSWMLSEWGRSTRGRRALAAATVVLMTLLAVTRHYPERVYRVGEDRSRPTSRHHRRHLLPRPLRRIRNRARLLRASEP